jgi:hypothetical protein
MEGAEMSIKDLDRTEDAVMLAVQRHASNISPATLIDLLKAQGFREDVIRVAMWELLDRERLRLTANSRLVAEPARALLPAPA